MRTLAFIALILVSVGAFGQIPSKESVDTMKHLTYHMKYPKEAVKNQIQGNVEIKVAFDSLCNITKTEIVKSLGYGCDEEALRVLQAIGERIKKIQGQKCKQGEEVTYPFQFRLN